MTAIANTTSAGRKGLFRGADGKSLLATFALVTTLFLLWGFCNGLIDILNKHFQSTLHINKYQSGFVQTANYMFTFFGVFALIMGGFIILNTFRTLVAERRHDIGMLRAIGITQRQTRRMIRHESVITALIGGAMGIVLGLVLGAMLVSRVPYVTFSLPTTQLVLCGIAAVLIGIIAAILPARRAAKLNVLEALQYE